MRILFFDTETNGLPKNWTAPVEEIDNWPRLVQIAWQVYNHKGDLLEEHEYVIKPVGFKIPLAASAVHKITTEKALEIGEDLLKILKIFSSSVNDCSLLVAHNYSFDYNIMGAELLRNGLENSLQGKDHMCTMKSTTDFCKIPGNYGYKWPKLEELYDILFSESFNAHDALDDIRATARCFWLLEKKGVISIVKYIKHEKKVETSPFKEGVPTGPVAELLKKYGSGEEANPSPLKEPANQAVRKKQIPGEEKSYYESGELKSTVIYLDGQSHALHLSFTKEGVVKSAKTYVDGKKDGLHITLTNERELGTVISSTATYNKGKKQGQENLYIYGSLYHSVYYSDDLKQGEEVYYHKGDIRSICYYVDGKTQGEVTAYDPYPHIISKGSYVDDKLQGEEKTYYGSGELKSTVSYVDGIKHGVEKEFMDSRNRELSRTVNYTDGIKQGVEKEFYESGELKSTVSYVDDKKHGVEKEFYESGELKSTVSYVDGQEQTGAEGFYVSGKLKRINTQEEVKEFYESGKLKRIRIHSSLYSQQGFYESGAVKSTLSPIESRRVNIEGYYLEKIFYESGALKSKIEYGPYGETGRKEGPALEYYESGALKSRFGFWADLKHGEENIYYESGKLKSTVPYFRNEKHGEEKTYYGSGELKSTVSYVYAEKHGEEKIYYVSGELKSTITYHVVKS